MLKLKTFKLDDYEGFNGFITEHSPRGENGIKFNQTHIMVFYEEGTPMTKSDKIQSLKFELGKHLEQQMHYDKQCRMAQKIRDSFNQSESLESWNNANAQFNQTVKMLELEVINTKVVIEMLHELGEKLNIDHVTVPDLTPNIVQKPIPSPMGGSKGSSRNKK